LESFFYFGYDRENNMLTGNFTALPRVRHTKLAFFILDSKFLFRTVMLLSGLVTALRKLPKFKRDGKPVKFPKRRIKTILSVFLKDTFYRKNERRLTPISKKGIMKAVDFVSEKLKGTDNFFGRELLIHIKESLSKKSALNKKYFEIFLIELAKSELKREFLKRRLFSVTFDINAHCNLNCGHCFAASTKEVYDVIDYDILKRALTEAREELGCLFFSVLGGEPLLSLQRLTRLLGDFKYVPFQVYTNGTLIDDDLISELEKYPNVSLLISIDGNKEINDSMRGKGTYKAIQKAFKRLKESKIIFGASITVTKNNFKYISSLEFAEILKDFGCFYAWLFDYKPIGRAANHRLTLTNEEKKYFNERISYINRNYPFVMINTERDPELIGGCPATKGTYLHIAANGDVVPCITIRLSQKKLNISRHTLSEIIDSKIFQDYRNISSFKGCAQQQEPEKFQNWLVQHRLEPMYESNLKN
jgi:MoaA/NifB/PqqE/SkfB family radical SAM enzyme